MNLKNITLTINESELSSKQIKDLEIANELLQAFNGVLSEEQVENVIKFDGETFTSIHGGYFYQFITDDINIVLQDDENKHYEAIVNIFDKLTKEYSVKASLDLKTSVVELQMNTILLYYKSLKTISSPKYLSSDRYRRFIETLDSNL